MRCFLLLALFTVLGLISHPTLALVPDARSLSTIQARGVGNGDGNRGDDPVGPPVVPTMGTNDEVDDEDGDDANAAADEDGGDDGTIVVTPEFLTTSVSSNTDDENSVKPGLGDGDARFGDYEDADTDDGNTIMVDDDDDGAGAGTPASPPVPAFFQIEPSPAPTFSSSSASTPTAEPEDMSSSTPTQTPVPTITTSDSPSSTPTQTPSPTIVTSDAPSSTPTQTPAPTNIASDTPSSIPTRTALPTAEPSESPSSAPTTTAKTSKMPSTSPTTTPTSAPTSLSTTKENQSSLPDPVTRFLQPFSLRLSVKDGETATDAEIRAAVKLSLEQLLETKLGLVFSDLTDISLDYFAAQSRSAGSTMYSFTGKGFFDSTPVTAPSHAAFQAAQMKVLFEFLFELEEMLKGNGIDVDTVVVQISGDVKQDEDISDKSSGEGQQDVSFAFDDDDDEIDDRETIVLGVQDEPSGSSSVYIVIASTLTVSVGLIALGVKRGFGRTESEPSFTPRRQPRHNVMVVDVDESPV